MDGHNHRIEKQSDQITDILVGQGEIKAEIKGLSVQFEGMQRAFDEKEGDRDKEIEVIWSEIGLLKGVIEKHEAVLNQLKGVKVLLWIALPIMVPGTIIVVGKFLITNFNKIFGIFM